MVDQAEKSSALLAGLDVGGTKIEAALVDPSGRMLSQVYLPMDARTGQRAVISIVAALRRLLGESMAPSNFLRAVGVAIPGKIHAGTVELAVNLKLRNYPLSQALSEIFQVPFFLENDVRTAALGAYRHFSSQRPLRSLVYLSIGTGIAAGLVLDGRLYRGANGMAGEVGHIIVAPGGSLCACGLHGCLETVAAGPAIAAAAAQAVRSGQATSLADVHPLDSRAVYQAYAAGDRAAGEIVRRVSSYLAHAIQGLLMAYDVDLLVLGGGVTGDSHLFLPPILEELSRMRLRSELCDMLLQADKIALHPKGINPAVLGAIELAEKGLATENLREIPHHS